MNVLALFFLLTTFCCPVRNYHIILIFFCLQSQVFWKFCTFCTYQRIWTGFKPLIHPINQLQNAIKMKISHFCTKKGTPGTIFGHRKTWAMPIKKNDGNGRCGQCPLTNLVSWAEMVLTFLCCGWAKVGIGTKMNLKM